MRVEKSGNCMVQQVHTAHHLQADFRDAELMTRRGPHEDLVMIFQVCSPTWKDNTPANFK